MAFTIDIPNRRLVTDSATNTIQEINDAARNFSDQPDVMVLNNNTGEQRDGIISASGKDDLGGGVLAPITIVMINDWRMYHEAQGGPTWLNVVITGGTLIASNTFSNNPIEDSAFVNWTVPVAQAGAILNLQEITDIWTRLFSGQLHTDASIGKEVIKDAVGAAYSEADIWSDDGATAYDGTAGVARRDGHVKP